VNFNGKVKKEKFLSWKKIFHGIFSWHFFMHAVAHDTVIWPIGLRPVSCYNAVLNKWNCQYAAVMCRKEINFCNLI
jgi:hypothetical protein